MRLRISIEAQVATIVALASAVTLATAAGMHALLGSWLATSAATLLVALPLAVWMARGWGGRVARTLRALGDGFTSLRDGDFSVSLATTRRDELGVIYSNTVARQMFRDGARLEGHRFDELVADTPASLREAVRAGRDTLFSLQGPDGEQEVMHLSQRRFVLNGRDHRLYLFKRLTRELTRQEVATWKKVIRVISHELNNSLAPISSLAHSGRLVAKAPDATRLDSIFSTIEERARHLKDFLEGYARFAKLPAPSLQDVDWAPFVARLQETAAFRGPASLPDPPGYFDPAQVQQVLINILKNAHESGSPPEDVELTIADDGRMIRLQVLDRGSGMSETVLSNALLPFYSTKRSGTGLGLSLCREIAEAHGGRLSLANRPEGGLAVSLWLPTRAGSG